MPPMIPEPSHINHSWCVYTPTDEISRPPHQQSAETTPALRGPARSSHPPQAAAERPSTTKKNVYIQPRSNWLQLQSVATSARAVPASFSENVVAPAEQAAMLAPSAPINAPCNGFQNTENP